MGTIIVLSGPVLEAHEANHLFMVLPSNPGGASGGKKPIGRGVKPGLDLAPDLEVSERHAEFSFAEGSHFLTDLCSTNGTCIERRGEQGALVPATKNQLQHGDVIGVGSTVLLYVEETFKDLDEAMAVIRRDARLRNVVSVWGEMRRPQEGTA